MLVNVPLVDQLNESTTDGGPDEAARANCVPASLTAAVLSLVPAAQIHGAPINGDALRDTVYPEGYTGATNPVDYVPVLASLFSITMSEFDSGDGNALVQHAIAALEAHQPVSAAIPSMWGNDYTGQDMVHFAGGTHEVTFCDWDGTNLTAMNPWPVNGQTAFYQTQPAAWWAERLVYGRVFVLSGGHMSITVGETGGLFTEPAAGHWVCPQTGAALTGAFLDFYVSMPSSGTLCGLTELGLPLYDPQYLNQAQYPGAVRQVFERGVLIYDPARKFDSPPGAVGAIYRAHVDTTTFYANQQSDPAGQAALATLAKIKSDLGVAA